MWADATRRFHSSDLVGITGDGATVQFAGATVQVSAGHLRVAAVSRAVVVIGQSRDDGATTVPVINDRGTRIDLPGAAVGTHCVGITAVDADRVRVWWLRAANGGLEMASASLHAGTLAHGAITTTPAAGTSQGFLDVGQQVGAFPFRAGDPPHPVIVDHGTVWTDPNRIALLTDANGQTLRYTLWQMSGRWVVGQGQDVGGVIAFDQDTRTHYRVSTAPTQLPPRIAEDGAGGARVAISFGPGVFVDRAAFVPLYGPTPPDPPTVPEGHVCVAALPNKCWISAFFTGHSHRYPGDRTLNGNAVTLVGDERDPDVLLAELAEHQDVPLIVAAQADIPADQTNVVVAWWCSGADLAGLAAHVAVATALPEKAVWAYLDSRDWPTERPAWITDQVLPSVQCYVGDHESLVDFAAAMRVVLDAVHGYGRPMVLTVQAFDRLRGQAGIDQALAAMPLIDQWCREYPIVGFHFFADRRPGGMADYPELAAWMNRFLRANPARPNRFDHWGDSSPDRLLNKLGQTTPLIAFTDAEKAAMIARLTGHT